MLALGSMKMEAMAKPMKTRAPMKVMTLAEMNLAELSLAELNRPS